MTEMVDECEVVTLPRLAVSHFAHIEDPEVHEEGPQDLDGTLERKITEMGSAMMRALTVHSKSTLFND